MNRLVTAAELLEDAINEQKLDAEMHRALDFICEGLGIERGKRYPTASSQRVYPCAGCGRDMGQPDKLCHTCTVEGLKELSR